MAGPMQYDGRWMNWGARQDAERDAQARDVLELGLRASLAAWEEN